MAAKPIPDGYHTVTPYLIVSGAAKTVDFLKDAFGAEVLFAMQRPDGLIGHAELKIGDSRVMIADASERAQPNRLALYLYVPDADASYRRAVAAGATAAVEPTDQFYGDRSGSVEDPAGNTWFIATHKEDVAPQELEKRAEAIYKRQQAGAG